MPVARTCTAPDIRSIRPETSKPVTEQKCYSKAPAHFNHPLSPKPMQIDASPMLHHSWQRRSSIPLASEACRRFCTGPPGFKASKFRLCLGLQGFLWHQAARKWRNQGSSRHLCLACKAERRSARLFVDGDTHSIADVKEAIEMLQKKGLDVWTTVYAAPRRAENKNWGEFFKGAATSFCPVPRREDLGEANDEQMMAAR